MAGSKKPKRSADHEIILGGPKSHESLYLELQLGKWVVVVANEKKIACLSNIQENQLAYNSLSVMLILHK